MQARKTLPILLLFALLLPACSIKGVSGSAAAALGQSTQTMAGSSGEMMSTATPDPMMSTATQTMMPAPGKMMETATPGSMMSAPTIWAGFRTAAAGAVIPVRSSTALDYRHAGSPCAGNQFDRWVSVGWSRDLRSGAKLGDDSGVYLDFSMMHRKNLNQFHPLYLLPAA